MTAPTREDVKRIMNEFECNVELSFPTDLYDEVLGVGDAYLALREEAARKDKLIKMQDSFIMDKSALAADRLTEIQQLQADNQALKAQITSLKWAIRNPSVIGGGDNFPPQQSDGTNIERI
ncbi:MAG: hypothetical protein R3B95_11805 [Nitrospirales bacterium]|nr:hypothetical protein [Nitrospirales bacterium]